VSRPARGLLAVLLLALVATSCHGATSGVVQLSMWAQSGTPLERAALTRAVDGFNRNHPGTEVSLRVVSEGDYNDVVQAAIVGDTLPDVLHVDGPMVASYADQHALRPLDDLLPRATTDDLLPTVRTEGTWRGRLWALGTFDSGLVLYADRRALRAAGVTWPRSLTTAWTAAQLGVVLRRLAAHDRDARVLDLKRSYGVGEWLTYGFAPLLSSAGGGLLDRRTGRATGTLDSAASVRALTLLQGWARYVDPDPSGSAFVRRRVALSWVGHWAYPDYRAALGDDLLVLPLPDLGNGVKSGQGSWTWGISARSHHSRQAAQLLAWLAADPQVAAITAANAAVPGTRSALAASPRHQPGGPLALFAEQLDRTCGTGPVTRACVAVPRPQTPAYPVVTTAFARAVDLVLRGEDPRTALREAAATIDAAPAG